MKEERREANKKKVKFHASLNKQEGGTTAAKKQSKPSKPHQIYEKIERNLRKRKPIDHHDTKSEISKTSKQTEEQKQKSQAPKTQQMRAPVGSLTNNPEWNGIIKELEMASTIDAMS